jgi:hypothetical protein
MGSSSPKARLQLLHCCWIKVGATSTPTTKLIEPMAVNLMPVSALTQPYFTFIAILTGAKLLLEVPGIKMFLCPPALIH